MFQFKQRKMKKMQVLHSVQNNKEKMKIFQVNIKKIRKIKNKTMYLVKWMILIELIFSI